MLGLGGRDRGFGISRTFGMVREAGVLVVEK